jgi:ATP-dependent DNA helicase DinG
MAVMRVAEWLAPDGPVARRLPAFETRQVQHEMAAAVAEALADGHHLAVEAGTGVGKTFGYLLPAIEQVACPGDGSPAGGRGRVVISTHTIALQEQLIHKDIPLLREALDVEFSAELVKGRNNYVGLRRLKQASSRQRSLFNSGRQLEVLHALEDWVYKTEDGSLSDLHEAPPPEVWEKVRSEHGNCLGRRCPHYEPCFYQRARRRAERAHILVVNHALLVSDLALRREGANVLPDYDLAIIDEGHTLARVAGDHFGLTVSNSQVQYLLSGLFNERTGKGYLAAIGSAEQRQAVIAAQSACTEFFNDVWAWQRSEGRSNGRLVRPNVVGNVLSPALRAIGEKLLPLKKQLPRQEDQYELGSFIERTGAIGDSVEALLAQELDEHVYWIDIEQGRGRRVWPRPATMISLTCSGDSDCRPRGRCGWARPSISSGR